MNINTLLPFPLPARQGKASLTKYSLVLARVYLGIHVPQPYDEYSLSAASSASVLPELNLKQHLNGARCSTALHLSSKPLTSYIDSNLSSSPRPLLRIRDEVLAKLLCEHMVDSLAIYVVYIHELPPSFSVFVSHLPAGSASISTPVLQWIRNRSC